MIYRRSGFDRIGIGFLAIYDSEQDFCVPDFFRCDGKKVFGKHSEIRQHTLFQLPVLSSWNPAQALFTV